MLLVCEDIHWIDPTSEELLSLAVERIKGVRVLVLATFRPSYQARWVGLPHVTLLSLNRLAGRQAGTLVSFMARGRKVSQKLIGRIVELADGVPLFLEELSRAAFTEAEISGAAEPAIPVTLTDSLTARIDQLGAGRELVQACSVIGRSFDTTLVCKLAGCDEAAAEAALERMVELGLANVRGRAIQAVYSFRHTLIQESAYRSMLRPNRQAVHRKLADILAADHAGESDASPEILAYHYEQADAAAEAIQQLHIAAKNAVLASANIEGRALVGPRLASTHDAAGKCRTRPVGTRAAGVFGLAAAHHQRTGRAGGSGALPPRRRALRRAAQKRGSLCGALGLVVHVARQPGSAGTGPTACPSSPRSSATTRW